LVWHQRQGNLCSIDRVADELRRGDDELSRWTVESLGEAAFVPTNGAETVTRYTDLIRWVQAQTQFLDYAKEQFAQVADGWLVAYAKSTNGIVVTLEEFDPMVSRELPQQLILEFLTQRKSLIMMHWSCRPRTWGCDPPLAESAEKRPHLRTRNAAKIAKNWLGNPLQP
jgi:Domain of unknown function (DUF4411)